MEPSSKRNAYFVPGEGISREVITADICKYLDNDAVVRPHEHMGVKGYLLYAYRNLTTAMLEDLRTDSKRWELEKRTRMNQQQSQQQQSQNQQQRQNTWGSSNNNVHHVTNSVPDYVDSRTHQLRQQASYSDERNSPSPSIPSNNTPFQPAATNTSFAYNSSTSPPFAAPPPQAPSPSQYPQPAPSPYNDTQPFATHHKNSSYTSLAQGAQRFGAATQSPASTFGSLQTPETLSYTPPNRTNPGFQQPPPFSQSNEFENSNKPNNPYEYNDQRNDSNYDFTNSRMSAIPNSNNNTTAFAPQPPHTAPPPSSRDSPYGAVGYGDQRGDQRTGTGGIKRPFREAQTEQRRFNGNPRGYMGDKGRRAA